jgi:hypothetical protein
MSSSSSRATWAPSGAMGSGPPSGELMNSGIDSRTWPAGRAAGAGERAQQAQQQAGAEGEPSLRAPAPCPPPGTGAEGACWPCAAHRAGLAQLARRALPRAQGRGRALRHGQLHGLCGPEVELQAGAAELRSLASRVGALQGRARGRLVGRGSWSWAGCWQRA